MEDETFDEYMARVYKAIEEEEKKKPLKAKKAVDWIRKAQGFTKEDLPWFEKGEGEGFEIPGGWEIGGEKFTTIEALLTALAVVRDPKVFDEVAKKLQELRKRLEQQKLVFKVDRLDTLTRKFMKLWEKAKKRQLNPYGW